MPGSNASPADRVTGRRRDISELCASTRPDFGSILVEFHQDWCPRPESNPDYMILVREELRLDGPFTPQ